MNNKIDHLDKRNAAMRTLAVDLAYLRKHSEDLIVIYIEMTECNRMRMIR
jgi:hypothetical protein